ncbi:MAG: hypothetical protein Q9M46_03755 [Ghiorsea sp.]|nr:hypothetical protein [Ghiorsea sp.]
MTYEQMIKHKVEFEALSQKEVETICALNEKLMSFEQSLVLSAVNVDKHLQQRVQNKDDMLIDYELVCEISFPTAPEPKQQPMSPSRFTPCHTGSDWTEPMKGISIQGSRLNSGEDYNPYLPHANALNQQKHCWLFHVLYAEFHMSWKEICRIQAAWSDLEVTHHYYTDLATQGNSLGCKN